MARYRLTASAALLTLALCCALTPSALASSTLLSGYGGPGQGNQAILGSTLIGGPPAAGGGGSGSSASGAGVPSLALTEASRATAQGGKGSSSARTGGSHKTGSATRPSEGTAGAPATLAAERVDAPALGLSGGDVAYMVLAFLVLALTAALTVLLMRRGPAGER